MEGRNIERVDTGFLPGQKQLVANNPDQANLAKIPRFHIVNPWRGAAAVDR
jgi:hypothetical protein